MNLSINLNDPKSIIFDDSSKVILIRDIPPYESCNFHRWDAGKRMDWHQHDYWQVIGVIEGFFEVDWGEGWQPIQIGSIHVLPPGKRHRLYSKNGHGQIGINFSPDSPDPRKTKTTLAAIFDQPVVLEESLHVDACETLARYSRRWDRVARLASAHALDALLLAICQAGHRQYSDRDEDRLLRWLQSRNDMCISVDEAASAMGWSRSKLQQRCQKLFGIGVIHLHERLRLERAARLLRARRSDSVSAIADRCGYKDLPTFSRRFKRYANCSPRQWREDE